MTVCGLSVSPRWIYMDIHLGEALRKRFFLNGVTAAPFAFLLRCALSSELTPARTSARRSSDDVRARRAQRTGLWPDVWSRPGQAPARPRRFPWASLTTCCPALRWPVPSHRSQMAARFMQRSPGQPGRGMCVWSRFARSTSPFRRARPESPAPPSGFEPAGRCADGRKAETPYLYGGLSLFRGRTSSICRRRGT